jgi:Tol biopolymer transport system component
VIGLAALVIAVSGLAVLRWWLGATAGQAVPPLQPKRVSTFHGAKNDPALSPDGNDVVFSLKTGVGADIWLLDVREGQPLRITDDGAVDRNPAWFPDGASIAFTRVENNRHALYRTPRLGGGAIKMADDACFPSISPDGSRIAFSRPDDSGFRRIWVAPTDAMDRAVQITDGEAGVWDHERASWSPDGRHLCYEDTRDIWTVPADGGAPAAITEDDPKDQHCAWSSDGQHVFFASDRGEVFAIWRARRDGGDLTRVTLGTGDDVSPTVSRDGRRLVYSSRIKRYAITLLDTATGQRASARQAVFMDSPTIAPDRSAIVFSSSKAGAGDLWRLELVGNAPRGEPQRLTRQPGSCANPSFSPDGDWIAYHGVIDGQRDIWLVSSSGGTPLRLTSHEAVDVQPVWSPDGSRMAFVSDRSGSYELWLAELDPDRRFRSLRQITTTAGIAATPVWSGDSSQIAFLLYADSVSELHVVGVEGGDEPVRLTDGARAAKLAWDHRSGQLLVCGLWGGLTYEVRAVEPSSGNVSPRPGISPVVPSAIMGSFEVSRDGRLIAWAEEEDYGDLWLLEEERWRF